MQFSWLRNQTKKFFFLRNEFFVLAVVVWYANCDYKESSFQMRSHACFWLHWGNFKFTPSLKNSHFAHTYDRRFNEFPWRLLSAQSKSCRTTAKNFCIHAVMHRNLCKITIHDECWWMDEEFLVSFLWCFLPSLCISLSTNLRN